MSKTSTWIKVRKFLNDIHLWGGLIAGIIVFIVCLTGTIYVYNTEIREAAIPEYYKVTKTAERISPDEILALNKQRIDGKIVGMKIPFQEERTYTILFNKKKEKSSEVNERGGKPLDSERNSGATASNINNVKKPEALKAAPAPAGPGRGPRANQMMVNPFTGRIIGDVSEVKTRTANFMQIMFGLHRWLLLNEIEKPIVEGIENRKLGSWISGTATILFTIGVITGIAIWFPRKIRGWKKGLKIRWSASWKRLNHDLHNTLGFYSCIVLFIMGITGPYFSFDWYRASWQKTLGTYQDPLAPKAEKPVLASAYQETTSITLAEAIAITNQVLNYDGDITINFPKDSVGTLNISKNKVGFFAPSASDKLVLDQYSGDVIEKDIFKEKPFNERASASIKALHLGDIYGPFSKIIYFISCLIATSLPVTGVLIWVNKMKKKPSKIK